VINSIDETHDANLTSWVESANGHPEFPIQNLPFGIVDCGDGEPRGAVAIGDCVLDLRALAQTTLFDGDSLAAARSADQSSLNALLALPPGERSALRRRLSALLARGASAQKQLAAMLRPIASVALKLPAQIGDYTDFYAGIVHARTVGAIVRPQNPLTPNYKYVPIGYHGRASSICPSGSRIRRPRGQVKSADAEAPHVAISARLDYEVELGIWIGMGNSLGEPIPIGEADAQIAGMSLLNDWSARDIQAWEYQPLGPFLAKNFASSISPWIVTQEALAPFRVAPRARPVGDPAPLPYLSDEANRRFGAYAIKLSAAIRTAKMRDSGGDFFCLTRSSAEDLYWTPAQLVAHHSSGGCNLRPGDLLGTGTISSDGPSGYGSLLELTHNGTKPVLLPNGEERRYLEDGDEVRLQGHAQAPGRVSIGFGECCGMVMPARG
jgi:fumarylacetoacetase